MTEHDDADETQTFKPTFAARHTGGAFTKPVQVEKAHTSGTSKRKGYKSVRAPAKAVSTNCVTEQ